ncbi:uridylate kinase [Williamsoniiplasma somnilux]|uniref:Uridylate kinase n=1 Tax=Williamsoniiplasma somnilux TaxID=215578 RepID=A0A2K8P1H7_9MOLU|nr:UMP kinase [Williamsoniiplasma somnilux]ATZ18861.1 uridylate kinase [Williamsoniiplasma somnilux]
MGLKYKTALLKLSGEALRSEEDIYSKDLLENVAKQIIELSTQGARLGIVVGGGNIWRGKLASTLELPQINADYMGMMATVMNGLALEATLQRLDYKKVIVYSALEIRTVTKSYSFKEARNKLDEGYILIFTGGTGYAHFTTDTGATIRAIEIGADVLLMAKNGVAGVYDSDPKINPHAKMIEHISYLEMTKKNLQVMDQTAVTLARDGKMKIEVFDMQGENNIVKVMNGKLNSTIIE